MASSKLSEGLQWHTATSKHGGSFKYSTTVSDSVAAPVTTVNILSDSAAVKVHWEPTTTKEDNEDPDWIEASQDVKNLGISHYRLFETQDEPAGTYFLGFINTKGWGFTFTDESGDSYFERSYRLLNDDGVSGLPGALQLQLNSAIQNPNELPDAILIIPQSHFHFDVRDTGRTRGLIPPCDPSDSRIRFPTLPAFLDSVIDTMFEPVGGVDHFQFRTSYVTIFLCYLAIYNIRDEDGATDPATEELLPAAKALLDGLKPENAAFLDTFRLAYWFSYYDA